MEEKEVSIWGVAVILIASLLVIGIQLQNNDLVIMGVVSAVMYYGLNSFGDKIFKKHKTMDGKKPNIKPHICLAFISLILYVFLVMWICDGFPKPGIDRVLVVVFGLGWLVITVAVVENTPLKDI